jgi:uncharacterized protein (TIGR02246 family)
VADNPAAYADRLSRLEARQSIADLVAQYCFLLDERRVADVANLFARDARYATVTPGVDVRGRAAIAEYFAGRFRVLGITNHIVHHHTAEIIDDRKGVATGAVSSHAEIVSDGTAMLAALRYDDSYVVEDGRWRFSERVMTFLYYTPLESYARALQSAGDSSSVTIPGR